MDKLDKLDTVADLYLAKSLDKGAKGAKGANEYEGDGKAAPLICISDIYLLYLFVCQQTNTKDIIAGQSAISATAAAAQVSHLQSCKWLL